MTRRLCLQEVLQNVLRRSPSRAANAAYSVFVIQSQSTVELNDNGISLEVGLGVAEQMLLNKPNLDMNKDTVFRKTGRCLRRLVVHMSSGRLVRIGRSIGARGCEMKREACGSYCSKSWVCIW